MQAAHNSSDNERPTTGNDNMAADYYYSLLKKEIFHIIYHVQVFKCLQIQLKSGGVNEA